MTSSKNDRHMILFFCSNNHQKLQILSINIPVIPPGACRKSFPSPPWRSPGFTRTRRHGRFSRPSAGRWPWAAFGDVPSWVGGGCVFGWFLFLGPLGVLFFVSFIFFFWWFLVIFIFVGFLEIFYIYLGWCQVIPTFENQALLGKTWLSQVDALDIFGFRL